MRESSTKLPATKKMHPPKFDARAADVVLRAHLHPRAPGARLRLARRRPRGRARDPRLAPRGGPIRPRRGAAGAARRAERRRSRLGLPHESSSAAATRWRSSPGSGRTAFRSRSACRSPATDDARLIRIDADPGRAAAGRGARLPDRARPRRGLHLAGELPGPRRSGRARRRVGHGPAQAGRRLRAAAKRPGRDLRILHEPPLAVLPRPRSDASRLAAQASGNGSRPACQGPGR